MRVEKKVLQTLAKEKKGQMPKMATCRLENKSPKKKGMHEKTSNLILLWK